MKWGPNRCISAGDRHTNYNHIFDWVTGSAQFVWYYHTTSDASIFLQYVFNFALVWYHPWNRQPLVICPPDLSKNSHTQLGAQIFCFTLSGQSLCFSSCGVLSFRFCGHLNPDCQWVLHHLSAWFLPATVSMIFLTSSFHCLPDGFYLIHGGCFSPRMLTSGKLNCSEQSRLFSDGISCFYAAALEPNVLWLSWSLLPTLTSDF